ncbi:TasA family protein [Neobacillus cucumis]|uniref:TasA family protein n=1 Tax=Neobacillus cucumis TaxID=1740721 RepID=UPI001966A2F1|nr:TasA family protein [Neobacillus cucumis]MBM7654816.1 putative ribosomally synthesized peptide with SipW-like signal peptide [Neobacillus cucumis]
MGIKQKFGGAVLTSVLGAALIGGGTFALFSSTTSNAGNTFTAGLLKVDDVTGGAVLKDSVNIGNLAPGDKDTKELTIKNTGNLDAWVKIDSYSTDADDIVNNNIGDIFEGTNSVKLTFDSAPILIPAGETHSFKIGYNFPSSAGNEYQGKSGKVTFSVKAVQARNNTNNDQNGPVSWQ